MKPRPRRPHRTRGVDLIALELERAYPGIPPAALPWAAHRAAAMRAKATLVADGRWPYAQEIGHCRRGHPKPSHGGCPECVAERAGRPAPTREAAA